MSRFGNGQRKPLTAAPGFPRFVGMNQDDLLPIGEAARLAGVAVDTLRAWANEGRVAVVRTAGGQRRFRRGDVEALVRAS